MTYLGQNHLDYLTENGMIDRIALFFGRVTMMMIAIMTLVMLYEVFMRYILERPTEWANEMTLWFASFVFLISGFYAMQQRTHIRIFLLYDVVPRWLQRVFDTISPAAGAVKRRPASRKNVKFDHRSMV